MYILYSPLIPPCMPGASGANDSTAGAALTTTNYNNSHHYHNPNTSITTTTPPQQQSTTDGTLTEQLNEYHPFLSKYRSKHTPTTITNTITTNTTATTTTTSTTTPTQLTTTLKTHSLLCSSNARRELSHGRETYSTPPGTSPWPWLLTHYT